MQEWRNLSFLRCQIRLGDYFIILLIQVHTFFNWLSSSGKYFGSCSFFFYLNLILMESRKVLVLNPVKHERESFITFPNTEKIAENMTHSSVFSTKFELFGNVMKHSLKRLIYLFNPDKNYGEAEINRKNLC